MACLYLLITMNNDALNTSVYVFVFSVFLGVYLGVELLGHIVTVCLTFGRVGTRV